MKEGGFNDNVINMVIKKDKVGWTTDARNWAGEMVSGQTKTGKILVSERLCLIERACNLLNKSALIV